MTVDWNRRKYTKEEFKNAWLSSNTIREVGVKLGLSATGNGYKSIIKAANSLNLNGDHMTGEYHRSDPQTKTLDDWLTYGSGISSHKLKIKLWNAKIFEEVCSRCGRDSWEGEKIPLCLDHKDGDSFNNVLSNLRILCLNCHGLTPTYAGRNVALKRLDRDRDREVKYKSSRVKTRGVKYSQTQYTCEACEKKISYGSKYCSGCVTRKTVIDWPELEELVSMVKSNSFVEASRKLGVSDNAIRKRLKSRGVDPSKIR